jgi:hypothetical protein
MWMPRSTFVAAAATATLCSTVVADDIPPVTSDPRPGTTRVVVAGKRYGAGPLHRLFLGSTWRNVWTTPVKVEVFDLGSYGGLKPTKLGGGMQTKSLRLEAPDGREFRFRLVDKDPEKSIPEDFRDTAVEQIARDQMSAGHPAGVLVVDGLAAAAGIPSVEHQLVLVPDDPRLGEFRKDFAGRLAIFEQNPDDDAPLPPGFEVFEKIEETPELFARIDKDPSERMDARAYVKARLFDFLIGDWDRHDEQWDWGRSKQDGRWYPIPKDRDQAFARYDGLVITAIRPSLEGRLTNFSERHSSPLGMGWNSRVADRRILGTLGWTSWEEAVQELQQRLGDPAIELAMRRLPPEYREASAAILTTRLKARRDSLEDAARAFYEMLARDVEAHGSDENDVAEVRPVDGTLEVRLFTPRADGTVPEPYFSRLLRPEETREVRVFLKGGDDRAVTSRGTDHDILIRFIGGPGDDVVENQGDMEVKVYDAEGNNRALQVSEVHTDAFTTPLDIANRPLRDWGAGHTGPSPLLAIGPDVGTFFGARMVFTDYGFRKYPYHYRHVLSAGYATKLRGVRAEYAGTFHLPNSDRRTDLLARFSQMELVRFHGFGNETVAPGDGDGNFYRVPQNEWVFSMRHRLADLPWLDLGAGPIVKYTTTRLEPDRFITQSQPYGVGGFGQAGLGASLRLDRRDNPGATRRGATVELGGSWYPKLWDVRQTFGEAHAELAAFTPLLRSSTLALRAGGKRVWGEYPFHEAAFIGGADTLRGYWRQRFAGDSAVYGTAELRQRLFTTHMLVPIRWGVFGLVDAGRVFLEGESSRRWHTGYGGGLFWSFVKPDYTLSLAMVRGDEGRSRIYLQSGFGF